MLLQTTLCFKICSWYFFSLEESNTPSWRNTGQSIYWQCPERTRTDQNERLQKVFDGVQGAELKFERQLEGHINNIARRKTENKIQLTQRHAGIVNSGETFISVLSACAHLHVLVQRKGAGMSSWEGTFSALKGLKWSYHPCMLLHQNTEQVFFRHLKRQHKAQYMCKNMMNFGCEWHMPPEYLLK